MALSRLIFAISVILYGVIGLGADISMRVFYWSLIVGGAVWILEGLVFAVVVPHMPARKVVSAETVA